jgi:hypothetical protein
MFDKVAGLFREASPLDSSQPNRGLKSSTSHFVEKVTAQAPFNQISGLAVHNHFR